MNPRIFCREPGYEVAILVTYSFDPLFFERVVLHDLWAGGSSDILIIADESEANKSVSRAIGQLTHLGRRYQLAVAQGVGGQHAKLLLRIGPDGAIFWLGSNNLTSPAWSGGNRELASSWNVRGTDTLGATNLKHILGNLRQILPPTAHRTLDRALDREWLASAKYEEDRFPVLMSDTTETLSAKLAKRWRGRRFKRAQILTGSTDKKGAMLKWLANTFGIEQVTIALDPRRAAFDKSKLQRLPLSVEIVPLDGAPTPHAKLLWLEGKGHCAAVVGSANCSAAAWLVPVARGGNVESVVVFDDCTQDSFRLPLQPFVDTEAVPVHEVTEFGNAGGEPAIPAMADRATRLIELSCDVQAGALRATVTPGIDGDASVELEISGARMPLRCADGDGRVWIGPIPDFVGGWTHFGRLAIRRSPKHIEYSSLMWVNEEDELQHSIRGRRLSGAILNLSHTQSSSGEQQKLLQELALVASALFSDHKAFPDPVVARTKPESNNDDEGERSLNPDELIRSIQQLEERERSHGRPVGFASALPLSGVMRVLFPSAEEAKDDELKEESREESQQKESDLDHPQKARGGAETVPERFRKKLVSQVDDFMARLSREEFAQRCTATQLVQAISFPLAVAVKAYEGDWIGQATAQRWAFKVTDLLFRVSHRDVSSASDGLLSVVRDRYIHEGRSSVFAQVVGDGRLWIALTAALLRNRVGDDCYGLDHALAIADVYRERGLWGAADPSRIQGLLSRLAGPRDNKKILLEARKTADIIRRIEERLTSKSDYYSKQQIEFDHAKGDPLWRSGIGFGRAEEAARIEKGVHLDVYLRKRAKIVAVGCDYYINLRVASLHDSVLARLLDCLHPCWPNHTPKM